MENELEKLGKKMPYTVPEGFFDTLEERLMQEAMENEKRPKKRNVALWSGLAVAASLALLLVLWHGNNAKDSFDQVETTFSQLSDDDQQLMLDYYEELEYLDNF